MTKSSGKLQTMEFVIEIGHGFCFGSGFILAAAFFAKVLGLHLCQ